jgi:hypothetical protein
MSFASSLSSVEEEARDLYLQLFHQAFEEPGQFFDDVRA